MSWTKITKGSVRTPQRLSTMHANAKSRADSETAGWIYLSDDELLYQIELGVYSLASIAKAIDDYGVFFTYKLTHLVVIAARILRERYPQLTPEEIEIWCKLNS